MGNWTVSLLRANQVTADNLTVPNQLPRLQANMTRIIISSRACDLSLVRMHNPVISQRASLVVSAMSQGRYIRRLLAAKSWCRVARQCKQTGRAQHATRSPVINLYKWNARPLCTAAFSRHTRPGRADTFVSRLYKTSLGQVSLGASRVMAEPL